MTLATTSSSITYQGDGSNTNWSFGFLIPELADLVVTVTTIADGTTSVIDESLYTVTGLNDPAGGLVTYPLSGSPLSTAYNITIQRVLPLTQTTELTNQGAFQPVVVEDEFDYLTMLVQQMQEQINRALAFPVGASDTSIATLMTDILNSAANATAAAASATAAAASAATIEALLPLDSANIADSAIISAKLASQSVIAAKLAASALSQIGMINGTLQASVNAGALTVSVKTLAGTDPTATDPVIVMFRDDTAANGDYATLILTAAALISVPSGATLGTSSGVPFRLWLVGFHDDVTFRLGIINCSTPSLIYPISDAMITSSTAVSAAAGSAGVFYTGSAVTTRAIRILGYLDFSNGQASAGSWITAPDKIQLFGPGIKKPGDIVQFAVTQTGAVATGTTVLPKDDSIPQNTEGDQYMSLSVTPVAKMNILRVKARAFISNNANAGGVSGALFQDSVANALASCNGAAVSAAILGIENLDYTTVANTIAATTFKFRCGGSAAGTTTFNGETSARLYGGTLNSFMQIEELQG